ncbi:putative quinol monooxygenase [Sinomonas sp.]|jgi:quinol monooxygenase YgiN|uniref:putative quinol monooxygenase n=1 Tax=Sinomonas sp. TaxID=1914986 RepID=UPI002FE1AF0E
MPVTVVAVLTAKPGLGAAVIESFREVSPLVHAEPGCELYAAHLEQDGDTVVMVERWATRGDLDAHAGGAALRRLNELNQDLLQRPYDVWFLDPVPLGHPAKGTVERHGMRAASSSDGVTTGSPSTRSSS